MESLNFKYSKKRIPATPLPGGAWGWVILKKNQGHVKPGGLKNPKY